MKRRKTGGSARGDFPSALTQVPQVEIKRCCSVICIEARRAHLSALTGLLIQG